MKSTYQCQGQETAATSALSPSRPLVLRAPGSASFVGRQPLEQPQSACPLHPNLAADVRQHLGHPCLRQQDIFFLTRMSSEDTWKISKKPRQFFPTHVCISTREPVTRIRRLLVLKGIGAQIHRQRTKNRRLTHSICLCFCLGK